MAAVATMPRGAFAEEDFAYMRPGGGICARGPLSMRFRPDLEKAFQSETFETHLLVRRVAFGLLASTFVVLILLNSLVDSLFYTQFDTEAPYRAAAALVFFLANGTLFSVAFVDLALPPRCLPKAALNLFTKFRQWTIPIYLFWIATIQSVVGLINEMAYQECLTFDRDEGELHHDELNELCYLGMSTLGTRHSTLLGPVPLFVDSMIIFAVVGCQVDALAGVIFCVLSFMWRGAREQLVASMYDYDREAMWLALCYLCLQAFLYAAAAMLIVFLESSRRDSFKARMLLARERIDAAKADMERVKQQSELLARASHEMKTPLHVASLSFEMLQDSDGLDPFQLELVDAGAVGCRRAATLVNDVLSSASNKWKGISLHLKRGFVLEAVDRAVGPLKFLAASTGLTIEVVGPRMRQKIWFDDEKLEQVLVNLVSNALKYAGKGTVTVKFRAKGGAVQFQVEDEGPGIRSSEAATIFMPFVQGGRHEGLGLGLSIVKEIVTAWGGKVGVRNRKKRSGAVFWFSLPLHTVDPRGVEQKRKRRPRSVTVVEASSSNHARTADEEELSEVVRDSPTESPSASSDDSRTSDESSGDSSGEQTHFTESDSSSDDSRTSGESSGETDGGSTYSGGSDSAPDVHLRTKKPAILVVDDSKLAQKMLQRLVQRLAPDIHVEVADDGQQGFDQVKKLRQDSTIELRFVIMDLNMPLCNGSESLDLIREWESGQRLRSVPVVLASATSAEELEAERQKFDGLLTKPFTQAEFLRVPWVAQTLKRS